MIDPLTFIQFEGNATCDAHCSFCPVGFRKFDRPVGTMKQDTFERIISEGMAMGVQHYAPFLNGEALINKRFFPWMDYLKERELFVTLFTNANMLTKDKADRLAAYQNVEHLTVSFHGGTKAAYEQTMGLNFERTKANVEYFLSIAPYPVQVYMLAQGVTYGTEEAFRAQWGDHAFISEAMFNWAGLVNTDTHKHLEQPAQPCQRILHHATILWTGDLALCCMDFNGRVILGNILNEPLSDIWARNQEMRDMHKAYRFDELELCRSCNLNRYGG